MCIWVFCCPRRFPIVSRMFSLCFPLFLPNLCVKEGRWCFDFLFEFGGLVPDCFPVVPPRVVGESAAGAGRHLTCVLRSAFFFHPGLRPSCRPPHQPAQPSHPRRCHPTAPSVDRHRRRNVCFAAVGQTPSPTHPAFAPPPLPPTQPKCGQKPSAECVFGGPTFACNPVYCFPIVFVLFSLTAFLLVFTFPSDFGSEDKGQPKTCTNTSDHKPNLFT